MIHRALFALALAAVACGDPAPEPASSIEPVSIEVATLALDGVEGAPPEVLPARALIHLGRRAPARHQLVLDRSAAPIAIRAAGSCPVALSRDQLDPERLPTDRFIRLAPLVEIEGERAQIGLGARFELRVVPRCADAEGATLVWANVGQPIEGLEIAEDGHVVRGTMPTLEGAGIAAHGTGVIAISPRTRGTRRLELTLTLPSGRTFTRSIELHAAARATGVPSVAVHARTYLSGAGLALVTAPQGSVAALERLDPETSAFVPDVRGRYAFRTTEGRAFTLAAGSHAATDLDCGRSECHASIAEHTQASPMTSIFARSLADAEYDVECAIACHAVGEPGIDDGGIVAMTRELGGALPAHGDAGEYDALPRELRRLSGVGCTTCHGPGAIPEPGARERILSADVCAVCHDAPPVYGHVAAWSQTRMGTPDASGSTSQPMCAPCHDTRAFLGIAEEPPLPSEAPGEAPQIVRAAQIACAVCHAPHAAETGPSLTRLIALPEGDAGPLAATTSRVCVRCHSPDPAFDLPTASAVALISGTHAFGVDSAALAQAAPHRALARGCLACHGTAATAGLERGASHTFAVDPGVCSSCHEEGVSEPPALATRIASLLSRLDHLGRADARPLGAPTSEDDRARWNVALVAGDRGAWAHGGPATLAILDAAEGLLGMR